MANEVEVKEGSKKSYSFKLKPVFDCHEEGQKVHDHSRSIVIEKENGGVAQFNATYLRYVFERAYVCNTTMVEVMNKDGGAFTGVPGTMEVSGDYLEGNFIKVQQNSPSVTEIQLRYTYDLYQETRPIKFIVCGDEVLK